MKKAVTAVLTLSLLAISALACFGQTVNTRVSGTIKDTADAVVPGVKVTLTDASTQTSKTVETNEEGAFVVADVRPGTYMVTAERSGFKKLQVSNVVVHVDIPAVLNMTLEAGGVAETVSVTASGTESLIRSEDAKLSTTIDVKQVQDLPLNGRNPINLAGGQAGVNTNGSIRTSSINGLRGSFSNITWDGVEINDNLVRTDSLFGNAGQSVAGVAEFTLTTQNAGPDEGLGIAQIKLSTPRGGSHIHGQIYDFYRNSKMDANTFFNNNTIDTKTGKSLPKPLLKQHQFGGNVGGPFAFPHFGEGGSTLVQKNKLFYYAYYEGTRTAQDATLLRTVLSTGARTGNFSYVRADNGQINTVNVLAVTGRSIDPRIQSLINLTPPSNNTDTGDTRNTQGFRFNSPSPTISDLFGWRIDYDLNERNRFEFIYSKFIFNFPNDTFNDIGEVFPGLPGGGQSSVRPHAAGAWHWSPSSNVTNEVRIGFFTNNPKFFNAEKFVEGYRLAFPNNAAGNNNPLISNPIQNFLQQGRIPTNVDIIDNATWVKGNHVWRFGGQGRINRILNFNDGGTVPQYSVGFNTNSNPSPLLATMFPGGISSTEFTNATALLGLLAGAVNAVNQTFNVSDRTSGFTPGVGSRRYLDYNSLSFYGGDTWRVRKNLSINLGLRWDYIGPLTERNGLALLPKDTSLAALNDPNVVFDFAGKGTGRPIVGKDYNNFAPNFSFAWDPFGSGKTSIRGGYSIAYAIDNNATVLNNAAVANNAGLSIAASNTVLTGTVSGGGIVPLATPTLKVPRTLLEQYQFGQTPTVFTTEFDLATPYAEQYNIGIERELWKDTAISVGYVGNMGKQLTRGIDTNQVIVFQNGFLADFLRAQANLALTGNPACTSAGCQTLTIFPKLGFTPGTGAVGGNLQTSTIRTLISQGQVGELAATYVQQRCTYLVQLPQYLCSSANTSTIAPSFFLPANPNAFVTDYIGSSGWSNYNGLQAEIRKRVSRGYYYQINYTWSKAYTNAEQAQTEFAPYLDNTLGDILEKKLLSNDVRQVLKGNAVYELPFGPGKQFLNSNGVAGHILGGWEISGIFQIRTGRPITITNGARGTVNRGGRSGKETASSNLSIDQLRQYVGIFFSPTNGKPLLFDPQTIQANGTANPAFFFNPPAGTFGNLALTPFRGPGYWNADMALIKRVRFKESMNLELRLEAFNVFNHTNFSVNEDNSINSTSFGRITSTFDQRIMQIAVKFNF
jgi:hypothetical protein